jgi:chromosomal replication initiation ATPase DnaA
MLNESTACIADIARGPVPPSKMAVAAFSPHCNDANAHMLFDALAKAVGTEKEAFLSPCREQWRVRIRHMAMYIFVKGWGWRYQETADRFEHRDHATVIWGVKAVQNRIDTDPRFAKTMNEWMSWANQNRI